MMAKGRVEMFSKVYPREKYISKIRPFVSSEIQDVEVEFDEYILNGGFPKALEFTDLYALLDDGKIVSGAILMYIVYTYNKIYR